MSRQLVISSILALLAFATVGCSGDADTKHQPGQSFFRTGGDVVNGTVR